MHKALTLAATALSTINAGHSDAAQSWQADMLKVVEGDARFGVTLTAPLNMNLRNMYAGHTSHSSHSSHSSHYSGSGGSYGAPAYSPPAPTPYQSLQPTAPPVYQGESVAPINTRPTQDQLKLMIMRVQAALFARGLDPGGIDGVLSAKTQSALRAFQAGHGIAVTGTMSTETLNALGISLSP